MKSVTFLLVLLVCLSEMALNAQDLPVCSLSKTNKSCKLVIDRTNPVAPSTVQMYSGQQVTVIVKNPLPFERYFLDFTTGQAALTPDVTSAILQSSMFTALAKLQMLAPELTPNVATTETERQKDEDQLSACRNPLLTNPNWPNSGDVRKDRSVFDKCFGELAKFAVGTYQRLEPLVAPDSLTNQTLPIEPNYYVSNQSGIATAADVYVENESLISNKITTLSKAPTIYNPPAPSCTPPPAVPPSYSCTATGTAPPGYSCTPVSAPPPSSPCTASSGPQPPVYNADDVIVIAELGVHQKLTDAVSADLAGYEQRIHDLHLCGYYGPADAADGSACPKSLADVAITSRQDDQTVYQNMVTRTITYSFDAYNLISYSQQGAPNPTNKKALAAVAINFADQPNKKFLGKPYSALRWEASGGVFFSWLPDRTFTLSSGTVEDSKSRPTPVPFAAANYRLTDDLPGRWKQNFYFTGAAGINPNTTTADFAAGPSYAWRGFMVSALCHFGHDTKLAPGALSSTAATLPTVTHWTETAAVGISVRVPSLTGR